MADRSRSSSARWSATDRERRTNAFLEQENHMTFIALVSRATLLSVAAAIVAQPVAAQKRGATFEAVARALGGKNRVLAVRNVVVEGQGDNYNLGQNLTSDAPLPRFAVSSLRRTTDVANT